MDEIQKSLFFVHIEGATRQRETGTLKIGRGVRSLNSKSSSDRYLASF